MKKIKIAITLVILFLVFIIYPQGVLASSSPFSVDYNILYKIAKDGTATVSYNINISNLTQAEYASSYSLSLTNTDVTNVTVVDSNGSILPFNTIKNSNSTVITTTFPQAQYGYGSGNNWTITFNTAQISKIQGNLLNIAIPGFQQKSLINSIKTEIEIPKSFGNINFSSPNNPNIVSGNNYMRVYYNSQDSYTTQGILLVMGNYQLFSFKFHYKLINYNPLFSQKYQIVIPADFKNQITNFSEISPAPTNSFIDKDGNYIISYTLSPKESINVNIKGESKVFSTYNILSSTPITQSTLSASQQKIYTSAQPYWQVLNPFIHNLALKITNGDSTNLAKALSIENYVASHLKYNQKAILNPNRQRLGAIKALEESNNAICQEYVDVFVTLARSIGLPARMIAGYGDPPDINVNPLPPDILHAWVQFYSNRYGWVNADPTWQSTSGNLNFFGNVGSSHFALARYGTNSENPPLILSFVQEKNPKNNINIFATTNKFITNPNFILKLQGFNNLVSGFTNYLDLTIKNTGNEVLKGNQITILSKNNKVISTFNIKNIAIFPYTTQDIKIPIRSNSLTQSNSQIINIQAQFSNYEGDKISKNVSTVIEFRPFFISGIIPWIIIFILFIISIILVDLFFRLKRKK